jgi:hypothetical protein
MSSFAAKAGLSVTVEVDLYHWSGLEVATIEVNLCHRSGLEVVFVEIDLCHRSGLKCDR